MNIHEYQAKKVLSAYGVTVPRGEVAFTPDEAVAAAERLGGELWVVKAQIHAGGRGKGGGVKLARSIDEVRALYCSGPSAGGGFRSHLTRQVSTGSVLVPRTLVEPNVEITLLGGGQ